MKGRNLALLVLALATGCGPAAVSLTRHEIATAYSPGEFAFAGAGRDLRTVVAGNPFGGDDAAFKAAVTDAMQGRHWGQRTHFTTMPDADARPSYRVVLLFGPPVSLNSRRLCDRESGALPTERAADGIVLFGAFCRGDKALTSIKGRVSGAAGPDDVRFRELVGHVTRGLFPPDRGLNRDSEHCPPWMAC